MPNDALKEAWLAQLHDRLKTIEEKIDTLNDFKAGIHVSTVIISGVLGFVSLVASSVVAVLITGKYFSN